LSRKKIISSQKGPNGGFSLTSKQKKINIYEVLEALDEVSLFNDCILGLDECSPEQPCPFHRNYENIRDELKTLFQTTQIQDLSIELLKKNAFLRH